MLASCAIGGSCARPAAREEEEEELMMMEVRRAIAEWTRQ